MQKNKYTGDLKQLIEVETGIKFNRNNKACCPIHGETKPSLSYNPNTNKVRCFGKCQKTYDAIDFIMTYKGLDYVKACKHLGLPLNETYKTIISEEEKIKNCIDYQIKNYDNFKGLELINLYRFTDKENKTLYFKAKFKNQNDKELKYYSLDQGKAVNKRNSEEVPYNLYGVNIALKSNKPIFIVEGEKDAETINHLGHTATSFKGIKNFDFSIFKGANIYFIGDTGQAGEQYKNNVYKALREYVKAFNVVDLPDIEQLGDNADVTDWLEEGHTIEELEKAIVDAWDWKKSRQWKYTIPVKKNNKTVYIPMKIWQNLNLLLKREKINLKYNVISKEVEATGSIESTRNVLLTDIYTLNKIQGLNMSREEIKHSIDKIANTNEYNPFVDYLKENENDNYKLIDEVFNCININQEFLYNNELYKTYFTKWLLNVVRMAHNTLENAYESQGVLVLQGGQGTYKSTFCKSLLPNSNWFKGGKSIDPSNKDSIKENTKYILVELGELDATLKGDQAKLKAFITADSDEYRSPYASYEEKHPRITSYCATVNSQNFLKDETGSRRFWIIPVQDCNIEKLKEININEFWGAVYSLYKSEKVAYWLTKEENEALNNSNMSFNAENYISIALEETFDWEQEQEYWKVYSIKELCEVLEVPNKESKALKNEMERRNYRLGAHRSMYTGDKTKKGYKLPNVNIHQVEELKKDKEEEDQMIPF